MNHTVETADPFYQGILENALRNSPPRPRGLAALMSSRFRLPIVPSPLPHPTGFRMPHAPVLPPLTGFRLPHATALPQLLQSGNHMGQTATLNQHQPLQMVHNYNFNNFYSLII